MQDYGAYISVTNQGTMKVLEEFRGIMPRLEGKRVLDVGCGTGILTVHYAAKNEVYGLDSNTVSVEEAKKKGLNARIHDLEKPLPFKDAYFDLVVCKDVLEFIFNSEQLVDEMLRVAKRKGQILLHVPNEFTVIDILALAFGKGILKGRWYQNSNEFSNPHIRFFTRRALRNYIAQKALDATDFSMKWGFTLPLLNAKALFLSRLSPELFSPGITFLCTKK